MKNLQEIIEKVWLNRELLNEYKGDIERAVALVNSGELRCAEPDGKGGWIVNEWVKKAVILYFPTQGMRTMEAGEIEYYDKIALKHNFKELGVRVVPGAVARYGAYISSGVILMPSFVNIGAWIGSGTMVDTWATVGSCAQIGSGVHLSGGVGIGGVLEPVQAAPVIIEDDCFIGSRAIVVEGARVCRGAVLGAGVVITGSTKIIDTRSGEVYRGIVPERAVVIPGTYNREYASGVYGVPCALIIGERSASTDLKTSLNDALRDNDVAV
ncbi:MAG: 2,3,4,5-tetrahydropyridine-2,6-dicarboxylate N-succinyltransferase [Rikenellaceae bacterium]